MYICVQKDQQLCLTGYLSGTHVRLKGLVAPNLQLFIQVTYTHPSNYNHTAESCVLR